VQLLITIDAECDNAWDKPDEITTENARYLPRFQVLCDKYGYKPTYITAHEMVEDGFFVEFARDALGRNACEIGLHPHPWNSPPLSPLTSNDMRYHPVMPEYPEHTIREKVKILTELLEEKFATKMYSHRAGRWAFNARYAKILCEFGYKVDCSVTPHIKWDLGTRPGNEPQAPTPDYTYFPEEPYFLHAEDISKPGNLPLLEIPMTVVSYYGKFLSWVYQILPAGNCQRGVRGIFGQPTGWFRPDKKRRELLRVARKKLAQGASYIMFMLHSSEFMPGANPTFKTQQDIEQLYEDIAEAFEFLQSYSVTGVTCYEFYSNFQGQDIYRA